MHTHAAASTLHHPAALISDLFDLRVNARRDPATEDMCIKFGVNGSSRFSVKARTHSGTNTQSRIIVPRVADT